MEEKSTKPRRYQFSWRTVLVLVTITAVFTWYMGTYCQLSRRGMREAKPYHLEGFYYVPIAEVFATEDLSTHFFRASFFAPANWVDRQFFGVERPGGCIMFHLS